MNTFTIVLIALVALLVLQFYQNYRRNEIFKKLSKYLSEKDYDSFDELLKANSTRSLFPPYNIAYLKLSEAMLKEDEKLVKETIDSFTSLKINSAQKEALYKKAFYYYVGNEDKTSSKKYYDLLMESEAKDKDVVAAFYDTYILKGSAHLEQILEKTNGLPEKQKLPYYPLIADMYRNEGNNEEAEKYEKLINA